MRESITDRGLFPAGKPVEKDKKQVQRGNNACLDGRQKIRRHLKFPLIDIVVNSIPGKEKKEVSKNFKFSLDRGGGDVVI